MIKRFSVLIMSLFFCFSMVFVAFASDSQYTYRIRYGHNTSYYYHAGCAFSEGNVYLYAGRNAGEDIYHNVNLYFVSDTPFTYSYYRANYSNSTDWENENSYGAKVYTPRQVGNYYLCNMSAYQELTYTAPFTFDANLPVIYYDSNDGEPWTKDDFELGKDDSGSGGTTSSIVYDSSIPAPQNVQFKSESVGGFLGVGSKWEHTLSWSNGVASPPLFLRVYSVAEVVFADTGQFFEDSTIPLLSADDKYNASSGRYSVGTDELSSKIMDGTVLNKVLEYRLQFCRYGDDGNLKVGPIATVHVKQNLFGKYDGYTVTTEYPKDDTDLGLSGGLDDEYKDKWTSDGEHYDDYDKDGNLVDSGTSEDSNPIQNLLNSLKNIPNIINSFFDSLMGLMSGVGQIPSFLSQLFSFLPPDIITVIGLGILLVIVLRIFGR
ncbi:hypothetical protein [Clostridium transplantifaecale]|uniref:hypothetical protein n=1 Tax=Clostridium transplantifaecale TaxID=2479838 RepID=UPI000F636C99|nr:hypothetical protein [Clostridium transplantifaecale]